MIKQGRVVALANGSPRRASVLPDLATTEEQGFADSGYTFWIGLFAPAGTPRTVIDRLNAEARRALELPEVRERLLALGTDPSPTTSQDLERRVREEILGEHRVGEEGGHQVAVSVRSAERTPAQRRSCDGISHRSTSTGCPDEPVLEPDRARAFALCARRAAAHRQSGQAQHQREPLRPVVAACWKRCKPPRPTPCGSIRIPRRRSCARRSPPITAWSPSRCSSAMARTKCWRMRSSRSCSSRSRCCFRTSPTASIACRAQLFGIACETCRWTTACASRGRGLSARRRGRS